MNNVFLMQNSKTFPVSPMNEKYKENLDLRYPKHFTNTIFKFLIFELKMWQKPNIHKFCFKGSF